MIAIINTTWENKDSVLFQPVVKTCPTCHSWMITAHVSFGNMEKQWKLFNRQMIRTHQLLPFLLWKPAAPTKLLSGLEAELSNLNSIYTSCQPLIQAATQLCKKEPSFDGIPFSSKHVKWSLLPFLGDVLSWLTSTATTKDVKTIKTRINQLISMQQNQQETLVHVISILNVTRYAIQINRQHINMLMDTTEKTNQDITTLYNIMHSLYCSISYQQIALHIRSILANLQDSLHYMWETALHTMYYINAAATEILSPHVLPVPDLREMLKHIEETIPSTMHLPISSEDKLHFYRYLHTHVLMTDEQFLLLIDVPIQDHAQQIEVYKIFNLRYISRKLLGMLWHQKQVFGYNTWWNQCHWNIRGPVPNMSQGKWTILYIKHTTSTTCQSTNMCISSVCQGQGYLYRKAVPYKSGWPVAISIRTSIAPNVWIITSSPAAVSARITLICPEEALRTITPQIPSIYFNYNQHAAPHHSILTCHHTMNHLGPLQTSHWTQQTLML